MAVCTLKEFFFKRIVSLFSPKIKENLLESNRFLFKNKNVSMLMDE